MKRYIIDAHNVLHKRAEWREMMTRDIDIARNSLLNALAGFAKRYASYRFSVVFDGENSSLPSPAPSIAVFSAPKGRTADEVVKNLIAKDTSPSMCVVVSSDAEVFAFARVYACETKTAEDFLKDLFPAISASGGKSSSGKHEKPARASKKEIAELKKLFGG